MTTMRHRGDDLNKIIETERPGQARLGGKT